MAIEKQLEHRYIRQAQQAIDAIKLADKTHKRRLRIEKKQPVHRVHSWLSQKKIFSIQIAQMTALLN